jgi:hypothetical protein
MSEFKAWPKIPRLVNEYVIVTEKMDGTNSCIIINDKKIVGVQSRNRLITREDDNYGFANWAYDNENELIGLGNGYHYGEWCGPKINGNRHQLEKNELYLFNTHRPIESIPPYCKVVPILGEGPMQQLLGIGLYSIMSSLEMDRPYKPEGVIVYQTNANKLYKLTFNNPEGKWKV